MDGWMDGWMDGSHNTPTTTSSSTFSSSTTTTYTSFSSTTTTSTVSTITILQLQYHHSGKILVFDDSLPHRAFNNSHHSARTVLIVDLMRPHYLPMGTATGQHTPELDNFVSKFK